MSLLPEDMDIDAGKASASPAAGASSLPPKPPVPPKPPAVPAPRAVPAQPSAPVRQMPPAPRPVGSTIMTSGGGGLLEDANGLRVSLMPADVEGKTQADIGRRVAILVIVLVAETVLLAIGYVVLLRMNTDRASRKTTLTDRAAQLTTEVAAAETSVRDALAWNDQLDAAKVTLDQHVRWTKFFTLLETKTLPTIKYVSFSGDADTGTVNLDAIGRTYRDVAEQVVVFRNDPMIADVRTSAAAARIDDKGEIIGVTFNAVIRFKPEAWRAVSAAPASGSAAPAAPSR